MAGEKIEKARKAALTAVDSLKRDSRLALITFTRGCSVQNYGFTSKGRIIKEIESASASGSTPIGTSLRAAYDLLIQNSTSDQRFVLLFTDGEETCGNNPCEVVKQFKSKATIPIYTVGYIVNEKAEEQLKCIAKVSDGEYFRAPSEEEISDAINEATSRVIGSKCTNDSDCGDAYVCVNHHCAPPVLQLLFLPVNWDLSEAEFRLLPAIADAIDRLEPQAPIRARLRGLQKYCWSHNIYILRTTLPVLEGLARAGIPAVVLKGGGVIARTPEAIRRRSIRDLDLLVRTADVPAAVAVLLAEGFRPVTGRIPGRSRAKAFDKAGPANPHAPERIEIDLHHRALHLGHRGRFDDDLVDRSLPADLLGRPVRVLAAVDEALVAIGQALQGDANPGHFWIGDALAALRSPGFDAAAFWERARLRRFDTHAAVVLAWLDQQFGLPPGILAARPPARGWLARRLDQAELRAMARPPRERGLLDRIVLRLAEGRRGGWRRSVIPARKKRSWICAIGCWRRAKASWR
jgi:uncharacterized protein YegL